MEYEIKLVPQDDTLPEMLEDSALIRSFADGEPETLTMRTTYYDTPSGDMRQRRFTLRTRSENGRRVATLKTPSETEGAREEYEVEADSLEAAIPLLILAGAPAVLTQFPYFEPVCGAAFTRRRIELTLYGSIAELALDSGILFRGAHEMPFREIEIELKDGAPAAVDAFAALLSREYGLVREPRSKFARAVRLGE